MQVVDGVAPVVFDVPTEGGEAHAHVQPGQLHAADVGSDVGEDGLLHHRHVVQIPAAVQVLLRARGRKRCEGLATSRSHLSIPTVSKR